MKTFIIGIVSLIIICFIASLILEGTRFEKAAGKTLGIIITLSLCFSCASLVLNIKTEALPDINLLVDKDYINNINSYKLTKAKNAIISELEKNNIKNCEVYFTTSYIDNDIIIEKIHLDLTSAEYNSSTTNINTLQEYIIEILKIDKEKVIVYL